MESKKELAVLVGSGVFLGMLFLAGMQTQNSEKVRAQAYSQAAMWSPVPRRQALMLIEKYGPPQHLSDDKMEWDGRWPWKRIEVSAQSPLSPLTQTVSCHVPKETLGDLERYSHGLMADARKGELSARSDSEELNLLSLNLGMEILTGQRTPEDANRYFYKAIDLHYAGKSVPYMEKLLFDVPPTQPFPTARAWFGDKI